MTVTPLPLTLDTARKLAVTRQKLAGERLPATVEGLRAMGQALRCVQLDPISAVARSHTLVTFSRVGPYDTALLDQLLFSDHHWFEFWAHAASIVLTEDYPLHNAMMRGYVRGESGWERSVREWMHANQGLHDLILSELREHGPMLSRQFSAEGQHPEGWVSTGWTSGRNVSRMLDFLWMRGDIMVAGRSGGQKLWDLTGRVLPEWADRAELSHEDVTVHAIEYAVRALGVAKPQHIKRHFLRGRYHHFDRALERLEADGKLLRAHVHGHGAGLRGTWYIHADDVPQAEALANGAFSPRTVLLSPFDNLICDRARSRELWDYDFTIEIYVPKDKRKYGYYVLSILDGDRLIGRIDPAYHKRDKRLDVQTVHAEPGAPDDPAAAQRIAGAIAELGQFLGAREIRVGAIDGVPAAWQTALRAL